MYLPRIAAAKLKYLAENVRAVAVVGPRQCGKTTLCKAVFPEKPYVSLENPNQLDWALTDPVGFLKTFPNGAIIDEAQNAPQLFSWLQQILDEDPMARGKFILSGSNQFNLMDTIQQSLAGRIGYLELLPFALEEWPSPTSLKVEDWLLLGGYPEVITGLSAPDVWFPGYLKTYVERDVRQLSNIINLQGFIRFIRLCAARIGTELNMSNLGVEAGINIKTVKEWLSVLQTSNIIWLLEPYYNNLSKRVVKSPKLYFHDTGLAAWLLEIGHNIALHPFKGNLFENAVINDLLKYQQHRIGTRKNVYFWKDSNGREIDLLLVHQSKLLPIEIKSGMTPNNDYFKQLQHFTMINGSKTGTVIYAGEDERVYPNGFDLKSWRCLQSPQIWLDAAAK
jgi:uncharacterized protein